MSVLRHVIDITPGIYPVPTETKEVRGATCPRCDGRGYFIDEIGRDEHRERACATCGGAGKLRATVTIEWGPDKNT